MGVQDAVLGMVVDQPDYGYRIVKRLEDEWSSAAVYKALRRLLERGLIEPTVVDVDGPRLRKPYRATDRGVSLHAARVARVIRESPGRREMLRRLRQAGPGSVAAVIDEYERQVLVELGGEALAPVGVVEDLLTKERRLVGEAQLRWIAMARETLDEASLA
jgi:DNA-binding PadR family transcriptional regulator